MKKYEMEPDFDFSDSDDYRDGIDGYCVNCGNIFDTLIATSNYANSGNDYRRVSISGDKGKNANFEGESFPILAPKKSFWEVWHNNIGKISAEENLKFYVEEYYKQILAKLKKDDIKKLVFSPSSRIFLCYEEPEQFCHRHVFVAYIKLLYGIEIPEVKLIQVKEGNYDYEKFVQVERYPLDEITKILERVIKENTNMKGFNSLMALRLFEESKELDDKAFYLEEKSGLDYGNMYMVAAGLRVQADDAEQEYNENDFYDKQRRYKELKKTAPCRGRSLSGFYIKD